jgi:hypothetical protein
MEKTYEKRMRIRSVKKITRIPDFIQYRLALKRWQKFIRFERKMQDKVSDVYERFTRKRLIIALNTMRENNLIVQERRERNEQIKRFYFNKQAAQIFDMLKIFLCIQRQKHEKSELAFKFRTMALTTKSIACWKKYMKDNYELFLKKKAVIKHLKARNCPSVLSHWTEYSIKHKIFRLKSEKSLSYLHTSLLSKSLTAFHHNVSLQRQYKALYKKSTLLHCQTLVQKSFRSLDTYRTYSIALKQNRDILDKAIRRVDVRVIKRNLVDLLRFNVVVTKKEDQERYNYVQEKRIKRIFLWWGQYAHTRKEIARKYEIVKAKYEKKVMREFMVRWLRKWDIEWAVKEMAFNKQAKVMKEWICACRRQVEVS